MSKRKINFAILGCGRVAGNHILGIDKSPDAALVALCDLKPERAKDWGAKFNVPIYDNGYRMLREHPEIDVVSIVTPSGMHFEHAMDILRTAPKHLLIEKPMVMTPAQASELKAAADRAGKTIFPIYQNRQNKAVQRLKSGIAAGELGDPVLVTIRLRWARGQAYYDRDPWRGTFSHDGGAMTNQGIHYLDLLRFLGGEVKSVNALARTLGSKVEVEDTAGALVNFRSGAMGIIEITTAARPNDLEGSISYMGNKGFALLSGVATNKLVAYTPNPADESVSSAEIPNVYGFGHFDVIQNVADVLNGAAKPLVEFTDGLATIELLHALYRSDELHGWVELDDKPVSRRMGRPNEDISRIYRTPKID